MLVVFYVTNYFDLKKQAYPPTTLEVWGSHMPTPPINGSEYPALPVSTLPA